MTRYFRRDGPSNRKVVSGQVYEVSTSTCGDTYVSIPPCGRYKVSPERWTETDIHGKTLEIPLVVPPVVPLSDLFIMRVGHTNHRSTQGRIYRLGSYSGKIVDDRGGSMTPKCADPDYWAPSTERAFIDQEVISQHHPSAPSEGISNRADRTESVQGTTPEAKIMIPILENNMSLSIETVLEINGRRANTISDEELISLIKAEKERAAELSALDIKSKKVSSMLIKCNANIDHLIEILDADDE